MMFTNEILWIFLILTNFVIVNIVFYFFKKDGLFAWLCVSIVIANIQVMKTTTLFGLVIALGNIAFSSVYLVTDMLNEFYGKKEAKKAIYMGFVIMITVTFVMFYTLKFVPHESDFAQEHLEEIFSFLPRITIASLVAFIISNLVNVYIFDWLKRSGKSPLWLRNNVSTIISEGMDNLIFTLVAFYNVFSFPVIVQIFFTSFFLRFVIGALDTPFIYLAREIHKKNNGK